MAGSPGMGVLVMVLLEGASCCLLSDVYGGGGLMSKGGGGVIYRDREEESVPHLTGRGELIGDCPSLDQGWVSLVEWLSGVLLNAGSYKNAAIYSVTEVSEAQRRKFRHKTCRFRKCRLFQP